MNDKTSNLKVKVACVFIAFFAWLYVMIENDPVDNRQINDVSISIANADYLIQNNLAVSPGQDLKANVKLTGRRAQVSQSLKNGISMYVTLDEPKIGVNSAQVHVSSPSKDVTYEIQPSIVEIQLEENVVKYEKVQVKTVGTLPEGYYVDSLELSSDHIYVSGPSSLIDKIDRIQIEVQLQSEKDDFIKWSKVKILDSSANEIQGLTSDNEKLAVTVKLKKEKLVPIELEIEKNDLGISEEAFATNVGQVKIKGSPKTIDKIESITTKEIKIDEMISNSRNLVSLIVPDGVQADISTISIEPKQSIYPAGTDASASKTEILYDQQDIQIVKDGTDLSKTVEQVGEIKVSFDGNTDVNKQDIALYVDLNYTTDDGYVDIKLKTDKSIKNVKISPSKLKVEKDVSENEVSQTTHTQDSQEAQDAGEQNQGEQ